MARTPIDYAPVFAYIVAHPEETLGAVAAAFEINRSTLGAAVKHESDKPGGGRLAGHPTYGKPSTSTTDAGEAAAVYVPVAELVPWVKNPRRNDAAAEQVADSIIRFGFGAPLLARLANREVIAGHTRIKAAHLLPARHRVLVATVEGGPDEETRERAAAKLRRWHPEAVALATDAIPRLPVRYRDLSETEAHALALADNRLGELAEWDGPVLAEVAQGFGADFDTTGMGWGDVAWGEIVTPPTGPSSTPDPGGGPIDQGIQRGPAFSKPGQVYDLGPHRLLCGDNTDTDLLAKLWREDVADIICTDPPFCSGGFQEAGRVIGSVDGLKGATIARDNLTSAGLAALLEKSVGRVPSAGCAYVFCDWRQLQTVRTAIEPLGYQYRALLVWDKGTPGMGGPWRHQHELVYFGTRRKEPSIGVSGDVLAFARSGNEHHTTEKPVALIEAILSNTVGEVVSDPFGGSGTTLIACARLGKRARLSEIDPHYCDVIRRRWTRWAKDAGVDPGPGALE